MANEFTMKVCDLTQSYAPTGGGIRTYLHAKRRHVLEATADEHLLLVPGPRDETVREGRLTTCTVASPLAPGSKAYRLLLRSDKVLRILERERPDVVEVLCAYNLPWTAMLYRRRHPDVAIVGGYRTDFPTAYAQRLFERLVGPRTGRLMREVGYRYAGAVYGRCDRTYALSQTFVDMLERLGVDGVALLPLGVELDTFHPRRRSQEVRHALGVGGPDEPLLIYTGRLDEERRPHDVVRAFLRVPESLRAHLVMVGDGPLREELTRLAAETPRMHVRSFVSDRAALAELLASADLYVSAMPFETFGISVIEAQACGLPVVGVASGAMPERVPPQLGRLGPTGDVEAMSRNIVEVLRDGREEMGRRARAWVEARYSWRATFERLWAMYAEILRARRRQLEPAA